MPLQELLATLYARRRFGVKPGVDRVALLLERLGNPEKTFRAIHVVGTNGKGSTSAFLSSILHKAGYRTAQFSSPHLVRFTERFRVNGADYPESLLAEKLQAALGHAPEEATFFEITTALAALIFSAEGVEIAVMEAGMGGGSDATAAFAGEMTVVTPISIDHTEFLGKTVEAIATEKAGIIKPGSWVISARQSEAATKAISRCCQQLKASELLMERDFSARWEADGSLSYLGADYLLTGLKPGIPGSFQYVNAALAMAAALRLADSGINLPRSAVEEGIFSASWPGRMEFHPGAPPLLLDGAHNGAGAKALAEALAGYSYKRLHLVTGICAEKDCDAIFDPLIPLAHAVYTVTPAVERGVPDQQLFDYFRKRGVAAQPCGSVLCGIESARSQADIDDLVLVCGSLFIVGETKAWLEQAEYNGIRG